MTSIEARRTEPELTGEVLADVRHPAIRRVRDVLRAAGTSQRTVLIDDDDNIRQAIGRGVRVESIYCTIGCVEVAQRLVRAAGGAVSMHVVTGSVVKAVFGNDRYARVFALARRPPVPQLRDLPGRPGDIVALDGVRLTGNIGAITRSALAFGAAGVVLIDSGLPSIFDRRLIRASRGAVFSLPLIRTDRQEFLAFLHHQEIPLVGLDARAPDPVATASELRGQVALLLGGEKHGTSPLLHQHVAQQVRIPTTDDVDSLNVSVAAAIGLYLRRAVAEAVQPQR